MINKHQWRWHSCKLDNVHLRFAVCCVKSFWIHCRLCFWGLCLKKQVSSVSLIKLNVYDLIECCGLTAIIVCKSIKIKLNVQTSIMSDTNSAHPANGLLLILLIIPRYFNKRCVNIEDKQHKMVIFRQFSRDSSLIWAFPSFLTVYFHYILLHRIWGCLTIYSLCYTLWLSFVSS